MYICFRCTDVLFAYFSYVWAFMAMWCGKGVKQHVAFKVQTKNIIPRGKQNEQEKQNPAGMADCVGHGGFHVPCGNWASDGVCCRG